MEVVNKIETFEECFDRMSKDLNLGNIIDRRKFIKKCNISLTQKLSERFTLSDTAVAVIRTYIVEIGTHYDVSEGFFYDWGSEIKIYMDGTPKISTSSCGSFDPLDENNITTFWRIKHSAELITNWKEAIVIITKYWKLVNVLHDIPVEK